MPPAVPRYRDLLDMVLSGQRAPLCPVFAHRHYPGADQDAAALAEATLGWQRRFDFDLIKLTPASTWQLIDYGVVDADDPDDALGRRRIIHRPIAAPDDWYALPRRDPSRGFAEKILRAAVATKRRAGAVPVVVTVYAPASLATKLAGAQRLAEHRRDHAAAVAAGLATLTEDTCRTLAALADAGIDGVFLAVQTARAAAATRSDSAGSDYAGWALRGDLACLEAAQAMPLTILHLHGDGILSELFRTRPASVLHFDASPRNPTPESLRASGFGAPAVSTGPSPQGCLATGTAAQCFAEARSWVARSGGSRFILAPGCTVPVATPDANLAALVAAARTPGAYRP